MRIPSLLSACVLLASSPWAQHDDDRPWYVQLGFGGVFSEEEDEGSLSGGDIGFDPGFATSLALGYRFDLSDRLDAETELEAYYQYFQIDEDDVLDLPVGDPSDASDFDEAKAFAIMVNAGLDWHLSPQFGIYGGLGVGYAPVIEYKGWEAGSLQVTEDEGLAFQGRIGLEYNLGGSTDFRIGYRYFRTEPIEFDDTLGTADGEIDIAQHVVELGFRWGL